jgi:hypothetical protein
MGKLEPAFATGLASVSVRTTEIALGHVNLGGTGWKESKVCWFQMVTHEDTQLMRGGTHYRVRNKMGGSEARSSEMGYLNGV